MYRNKTLILNSTLIFMLMNCSGTSYHKIPVTETITPETKPQETIVQKTTTTPTTTTEPIDVAQTPILIPKDVGTVIDTSFKITDITKTASYALHLDSDWETACEIKKDATVKDISCTLDATELDLFYNGVNLQYNIPKDQCDYLEVAYPWFYNYPIGDGPISVSYDINLKGVTENAYSVQVTGATPTPIALTKVAMGLIGAPICNYNYKSQGGPNCCMGNYTLSVRNWNFTTNMYDPAVVTTESWGGNVKDCIVSPTEKFSTTSLGTPQNTIFNVTDKGLNEVYTSLTPYKSGQKNVLVSSFFSNANSTVPEAFKSPTRCSTPECRAAIPLRRDLTTTALPMGNWFFSFNCLDKAYDLNSRITLRVRQWSKLKEFNNKQSGDPRITGDETGYPIIGVPTLFPPFKDTLDWDDYFTIFPLISLTP